MNINSITRPTSSFNLIRKGWGSFVVIHGIQSKPSKSVFVAAPHCLIEMVADPFVGGLEIQMSCGLVQSGWLN